MQIQSPNATGRPRVAAIVLNSVNHDARVLKEADSLAKAGFDVHILGIQDKRCDDALTQRSSHVTIHRIGLQANLILHRLRARKRVLMMGIVAMLVLSIGILVSPLRNFLKGFDSDLLSSRIMEFGLVPILSLILIAIAIAVLALATSRISLAASKKRSAMEGVSPPPRRKPSGRSGRSVLRRLGSVARPLATLLTQRLKYRVVSRLYRAELERLRPDALHCHDLPMLPIGVSWRRDHPSVFLVFDSHELYEEVSQMTPIKRFFCQRLLRRASPMVDAFITVNDSIAGEHARRYPSLPSAVVVKNATIVDGEPLIRSDLLREAAGLDDDALVLLYQGGFAPHRGLERLIRAAASMPEPWVLVMMGWGNIEGNLKSIASEVDQDGRRIRFIPPAPQADLRAWTSGGDLGVIPYENTCLNHWFCSPNKLWEYPIAGVPMLVSPFPELKSAVEDHGIGICLPDELTNEGLSEVLSGITRDRLDAMKLACGRYIEHDNWSIYAGRLIEMYTTKFPADRIGA